MADNTLQERAQVGPSEVDKSEHDETEEDAPPNAPKTVDDIMNQLERMDLNSEDAAGTKMDECMAKLHALLSKEPSKILERATSRAMAQKKYYRRATQIFAQAQHDGKDVFPFLALSAEIRLEIYFQLLVSDDCLALTWRGPRKVKNHQRRMYIDILLTCRLCREEGVGVLYGENVFDFGEICNRPISVAKPFLSRIGPHNASLIRVVLAEYSAAAEELSERALHEPGLISNPPTRLSVSFIREFLSSANISLSRLRMFAISITPYGYDLATDDLMKLQDKRIMGTTRHRNRWLNAKNDSERMKQIVESICDREKGLVRADYNKDVDRGIRFHWSPPFVGREWIMYEREKWL